MYLEIPGDIGCDAACYKPDVRIPPEKKPHRLREKVSCTTDMHNLEYMQDLFIGPKNPVGYMGEGEGESMQKPTTKVHFWGGVGGGVRGLGRMENKTKIRNHQSCNSNKRERKESRRAMVVMVVVHEVMMGS